MSKTKTYILFLLAVFLLPALPQLSFATGPDTLWTRDFWYELNAAEPEYYEFHPINDSIFTFTSFGKDSNGVDTDEMTAHFVNTITGEVFLKYAPIRMAHYTPDGNFLIGHNDSTIAYISLDSLKPVRSYPIMKNALGNFTIDERGKYVYTTGYTDTNKKFGFFRWSIDSGTVEQINLPDSLFQRPNNQCPPIVTSIEKMFASDTAKILLMQIYIDRPLPFCSAETRIWGIDLNADTVKYDFMKLDPSIQSSYLTGILPYRTKFISFVQKDGSAGSFIFDIATGDSIREFNYIGNANYTITKDETYLIKARNRIEVFNFSNYDTVYTYSNINGGPVVISPNNEFILLDYTVKFVLYPTPWYPTSIAEPREDTPQSLIYPNPGTDEVWINNVILSGAKDPVVLVFDVLGIEVLSLGDSRFRGNDIFVSAEGNLRIDVSSLSPGVYFVRVGGKVSKFVKI